MNHFVLHTQLANDCFQLGQFSLCQLLMMNDKNYPWFILVPKRNDIKEAFQLSPEDYLQLNAESHFFSELLHKSQSAHKINIAALGNMVPQLHVHIIARFTTDPSWPKPIWGNLPPEKFQKQALLERIDTLLPLLSESSKQAFIWDEQWV